ncbi:NAD(P)H oxidoreductase RTN4IP1, mitochondrial-like [Oratosquilla oratoria]|uniref:NAD(P)H oxidoreductase RTN4IP1, mitochondrial-like n=1 Tax=Oratosquilla oratoria TaxID=337810 RepID=UPI003F76D4E8
MHGSSARGLVAGARLAKFNFSVPLASTLKAQCKIKLLHPGQGIHTTAKINSEPEPEMYDVKRGMKIWQTYGYGGIEEVGLGFARIPHVPRPGDVLVKVLASSVNPIDTAMLNGYGSQVIGLMRGLAKMETGTFTWNEPSFPLTVGRDFSGIVEKVGHGVNNLKVGDVVWGVVSPQRQGAHAEYVLAAASNVCTMPDTLTPEEGASIPYVALTTWSALTVSGLLTPFTARGCRVLLLGASGGIGTFASQLMSSWGVEVVSVCSKDNFDLVAGLGSSQIYDYQDPSTKEILISQGNFDLILNASGTEDMDYLQALKSWTGASFVTLSPPLLRNTDKMGIVRGMMQSVCQVVNKNALTLSEGRAYKWAFYMPNPLAFKEISSMVAKSQIVPVINRVYSFSETPEAYLAVSEGHGKGKTVITLEE